MLAYEITQCIKTNSPIRWGHLSCPLRWPAFCLWSVYSLNKSTCTSLWNEYLLGLLSLLRRTVFCLRNVYLSKWTCFHFTMACPWILLCERQRPILQHQLDNCCGGSTVHCGMISSIPGLRPLDASSNLMPQSPRCNKWKHLQTWPDIPKGENGPRWEPLHHSQQTSTIQILPGSEIGVCQLTEKHTT